MRTGITECGAALEDLSPDSVLWTQFIDQSLCVPDGDSVYAARVSCGLWEHVGKLRVQNWKQSPVVSNRVER